MIRPETLARRIEAGLNKNVQGLNFKIFSEVGQYKKAVKTQRSITKFINGVLTITDSTVVPMQTLTVASQTAELEIVVPLKGPDEDEKTAATVRGVLDDFFKTSNVQVLEDEDGKLYSVGAVYNLVNTGSVEPRATAGFSLTFVCRIDYSFIQNGLNSLNCTFTLDGVQLPYSQATLSRVPVMESSPYSGSNGAAQNIPSSTALGVDMTIAATSSDNAAGTAILSFLLEGGAGVHTLEVDLGGSIKTYSVVLGQTNITLDGIDNAGHRLSFVEAADILGGGYGGS